MREYPRVERWKRDEGLVTFGLMGIMSFTDLVSTHFGSAGHLLLPLLLLALALDKSGESVIALDCSFLLTALVWFLVDSLNRR